MFFMSIFNAAPGLFESVDAGCCVDGEEFVWRFPAVQKRPVMLMAYHSPSELIMRDATTIEAEVEVGVEAATAEAATAEVATAEESTEVSRHQQQCADTNSRGGCVCLMPSHCYRRRGHVHLSMHPHSPVSNYEIASWCVHLCRARAAAAAAIACCRHRSWT